MSAVGTRTGDLISAIGSTPLVELPRLRDEGGARLYAKLEMMNPTGSVKDRVARSLIEAAEAEGRLLAGPGRARADERQHRHLAGDDLPRARLPHARRDAGVGHARARRLAAHVRRRDRLVAGRAGLQRRRRAWRASWPPPTPTVYMPFQYANPANPDAHYRTTGPEIIEALGGRVDAFVAGLGTGGTLMGTGQALREAQSRGARSSPPSRSRATP